ncbi:MAG: 2-amino-4-hydroxy-6-hydroxymethyldihydropteridine diphosphokinase [Actinobacteria bacterium]|uniref:2-amino-4-hydroxy-6-hydroxymethyldihydropteridine diphosphokinase n=1 Tax=freshwater metagenome TaxID=449393 RepID=A0A6J6PBR2_9ZZZZ|nr:2-amino-4-hydroxy-6-hydroxymethyldihydropteridine diphosphokinase [Actinomycetota bacterium]
MKAVIAIGSNLGDRELNIDSAVAEIAKIIEVTHLSTNYETDPVGGPDQPKYLNAVLIADSVIAPHELLKSLLQIETRLGRTREVHWGPRTIDLDLIIYGEEIIDSADLVLPHPRAHERRFVLEPWAEIDPEAEIPSIGRIEDILLRI